jgi:segregation and condensation protein B
MNSSETRTGPARPSDPPENSTLSPAPGSVVRANSLDAELALAAEGAASESSPANEHLIPSELPATELKAIVEAVIYVTDEPLSADQIATALQQPAATVGRILEELAAEYSQPGHGLTIREVAGGYKMSTKPEHHEAVRAFVRNLKPPLRLSLPALETLALIAYKQPITAPEIMEVRGVQGAGVLKTLLDRRLIATAGRKTVVGKPILYKTTKDFLVQFGLKDLSELPTLKEFEELGRLSMAEATEQDVASPEIQGAEPADADSADTAE